MANKFLVIEMKVNDIDECTYEYMTWFKKKKEAKLYLENNGYYSSDWNKDKFKDQKWNIAGVESVKEDFWFCRQHRHNETRLIRRV